MTNTTTGSIQKLIGTITTPITYSLPINNQPIALQPLLGKTITLNFTGKINCISCQRAINKSFAQGHCFKCFQTLPECDICIMQPEKCHFTQNTCRNPNWGKTHCHEPHIVYLANTSGLKVGITRLTQIPTRWIDQGAIQALPIFQVENRLQSGIIEAHLRQFVADKTNWRKMLENNASDLDLIAARDELLEKASLVKLGLNLEVLPKLPVQLTYPLLQKPSKIEQIDPHKTPKTTGILLGIKGQYLIFEHGVLNIRKFSGYEINFSEQNG
ncbi:MAG: hypothetical protein A2X78_00815 [Gammaproteobacteria bacterium GWE2_37_16]|nr:MAG: hypothetical protein A2X78_00815 [Gammaproteobacteria bacterium GWE2_37_16]